MIDAAGSNPIGALEPCKITMRAHLQHLFGGCHEGLIELAWSDATADASGRYRLRHAQLFRTDLIEELITKAMELNSKAKTNIYIGAVRTRQRQRLLCRARVMG
jgi:hypothetical protein